MKRIICPVLILSALAAAQQPPVIGEINAFRTEKHAYLVHPLEDLGLEGVVSVEAISVNAIFVVSLNRDARESTNGNDSSPALQASVMRIDNRRQVILPVPAFRANDYFRQPRSPWISGVNCAIQFPVSESDPGTLIWINTETLRVTSLPGNYDPVGMFDTSRILCDTVEQLVAVNQQGNIVGQWDAPANAILQEFDELTKVATFFRGTRNPAENSWFTLNLATGQAESFTQTEFWALYAQMQSEREFANQEPERSDTGFGVESVAIADETRAVVGQWWRIYPSQRELVTTIARTDRTGEDQTNPISQLPHELPRGCPVVIGGSEVQLVGTGLVVILRESRVQIRRIQEISLEDYEALIREEYKQKALRTSKQIGIALHIYSADYDDFLPPNANWKDNIQPYLNDRDMVAQFVYLGDGLATSSYDDLTQPLGYIDTPYGRAIVRVDASARWVPRP